MVQMVIFEKNLIMNWKFIIDDTAEICKVLTAVQNMYLQRSQVANILRGKFMEFPVNNWGDFCWIEFDMLKALWSSGLIRR